MSKQGIIGRVMQLARANVNAMIDSAEDPQKMLDQLVRDYSANISEAEQAVAQLIGNLRMAEEDQQEDARAVVQWNRKAEAASQKADELRATSDAAEADKFDDLARVALERQMIAENDVETMQHTITAQNESVEKLKNGLDQMKIKLSELKHKRDSLVMRSRSAEAQSHLQEAVRRVDIMDPSSEVNRFEEKVRRQEAMVAGHEEIEASSIDAQFAGLEDDADQSEIEDRLRALKAGRSAAADQKQHQDQPFR
jgi:phage shock protein A